MAASTAAPATDTVVRRPRVRDPRPQSRPPAAVADLLAGVPAETADLLTRLRDRTEKSGADALRSKWDRGNLIEQLRTDVKYTRSSKPGETVNPLQLASQTTGLSAEALNKEAQFYRIFSDVKNRDWLLALRTERGIPLTYKHVVSVLRLASDDEPGLSKAIRSALEQAAKHNWSPDDLNHHIKAERRGKGQKEAGGAGRPFRVPPTASGRLTRLTSQAAALTNYASQVTGNPKHSVLAALKTLDQAAVAGQHKEFLDLMNRTREELRRARAAIDLELEQGLPAAEAHINLCIRAMAVDAGRAKAAKAADAA
jgi:hypothetical protein